MKDKKLSSLNKKFTKRKAQQVPKGFAWTCDKCHTAKFKTLEEAEAHEKICTGTPSMMEEENNNNVSSSEETSDEVQTNFESRLSGLLGQIHTDIINICENCGKTGDNVNNECNKCHAVKYCNAICKKKHRKKHKKACETIVALQLVNSNTSSKENQQSVDTTEATHPNLDDPNRVKRLLRDNQDMDAICDVCFDGEVAPENQIIFCDGCNVAVHQRCYGIDRIPTGNYFCHTCVHFEVDQGYLADPPTKIARHPIVCELCPRREGAFVQVETVVKEGQREPKKVKWVHVGCAKWQGMNYVDKATKDMIEDLTPLTNYFKARGYECCLCKGKMGALHQCREEGCDKFMHLTCARSVGKCSVQHGENCHGYYNQNELEHATWSMACPKHSVVDLESVNDKIVISEYELQKIAETYPLDTGSTISEDQEEEDTSPSPSSLSNINKDNRMIRLFESIKINDDRVFDSDNARLGRSRRKDALFKILNNEDDHFVLSDTQQNGEQQLFGHQQRMSDATLFQLPHRQVDCQICNVPLPYLSSGKVYMSCCGKYTCRGCIHAIQRDDIGGNGSLCVLCKVPMSDSDEEITKRYIKRIVLVDDDGDSACSLGCFYQSGMFCLSQSYSKALNLYYLAASLGSAEAYCNIADAYDRGLGVERDYEKAWHYYEYAAMSGNVQARYNIGVSEMLLGNTERALKHFMIAVKTGNADSLMKIKQLNVNLHATDQEYLEALMTYNSYVVKIESPRRDQAAAFSNDYRYYEPLSGKVREEAEQVKEKLPNGVKEDDIRLVMSQASVSRKRAIKALVQNDDCIDAIMSLAAHAR